MKKHSFKARFKYWLDNIMAKGTGSMILFLILGTLFITFTISFFMILFGADNNYESGYVVWNVIAYTFNKWFPFSTDGTFDYLVPAAIASISGILFTSILIGLITSAIEGRVNALKKGNSVVLEDNHIVILGFVPGEYTLISQLIVAADGKPRCIVVADSFEKDEMEALIRDNVDIPKNIKIICRNVNICDPQMLKCCAIADCSVVVVSPIEGDRVVKAILAVLALTNHNLDKKVRIIAAVNDNKYILPSYMQETHNIHMLQASDIIARFVARSCTQHGISGVLEEIYGFEGAEFYSNQFPELVGTDFAHLTYYIDDGVPVGFIRKGNTYINPSPEMKLEADDRLVFFSSTRNSLDLSNIKNDEINIERIDIHYEKSNNLLIFGYNETFPTMIYELPEDIKSITLIETGKHKHTEDFRCVGKEIHVFKGNINNVKEMRDLVKNADQIILIDNHKTDDPEGTDIDTMMLMLKLRTLKEKFSYHYSITSEFVRDSNRRLMLDSDATDCIVANNMTSMVLAQIVESPELIDLFKELLSDFGCEVHMKTPAMLNIETGEYTVQELRKILLARKHLLLGYRIDGEAGELFMESKLADKVVLNSTSRLAVIAEK